MSQALSDRPDWRALWRSGDLGRFTFICLGIFLHAAGETLFATIVPAILREIGGASLIAWNLALYQIGSIVAAAATGLLSRRLGLRMAMTSAAGLFAVGCVICALAPAMEWLLIGRLLQGLGGGTLIALAFIAVERLFPRAIWPQLMSIMSVVWGSSSFLGPLIGGGFGEAGLWREAFWSFAFAAILLASTAAVVLARAGRPIAETTERLPLVRLAALAGAIVLICAAGISVAPLSSAILILAGLAGIVLFLRLDAGRGAAQVLPSRPFDPTSRVGAGLLMIVCLSVSTVSFWLYGPVLLNTLHGLSLLAAGYIAAAEAIAWSVAAILVANAPPSAEKTIIRGGALFIFFSIATLMLSVPAGMIGLVAAAAIGQGAGYGFLYAFAVRRIVEAAPEAERTVAASAIPTVHRAGYAVGAALSGIVANLAGFSEGLSLEAAIEVAFWVFAAFLPTAAIGLAGAWRLSNWREAG